MVNGENIALKDPQPFFDDSQQLLEFPLCGRFPGWRVPPDGTARRERLVKELDSFIR